MSINSDTASTDPLQLHYSDVTCALWHFKSLTIDCLLNSCFILTTTKKSKVRVTALCGWNHTGPVIRKASSSYIPIFSLICFMENDAHLLPTESHDCDTLSIPWYLLIFARKQKSYLELQPSLNMISLRDLAPLIWPGLVIWQYYTHNSVSNFLG